MNDPNHDDDELDPIFACLIAGMDPVTLRERWEAARPKWHARAACRGMGADLFFPGRGGDLDPARAVCAECPVRIECGRFAVAYDNQNGAMPLKGVWGGTSERERLRARRAA